MRIISGKFKGKRIVSPKDKATRPLRDLVKESIFNVIKHSNKIKINIEKSVVLDLFSGSGSFGLEAISRGAKRCLFVENYSNALEVLNKNIKILKCENNCSINCLDCFSYIENLQNNETKSDLIFLDPPYKEKNINVIIEKLLEKNILSKNGIIVIHRHKKDDVKLTDKLNIIDLRLYGISKIIFAN
ncbi:16S rRNA (guanine(966)-N(2))-methyltransferase RsmD [Candidatus Pelagibacter sp.]|nr:16S rRNA (guanine(966)-N(2))-methyltransferase RsmD [Candidatus Pelagibacter sp.]